MIKMCVFLKNTMHGSYWKNFQIRFGTSKYPKVAKKLKDTSSVDRRQIAWNHKLSLQQRMWSC